RSPDSLAVAPVDSARQRACHRQAKCGSLAEQALEAVAGDAPGLDLGHRADGGRAMCEEQPELAERGWCGDRPDRSFDAVDADAQLDLAAPQQIERVGGRAFP